MEKSKTAVWDPAEHLQTEADIVAYLEAAMETGDPGVIAAARQDITRAKIRNRTTSPADYE